MPRSKAQSDPKIPTKDPELGSGDIQDPTEPGWYTCKIWQQDHLAWITVDFFNFWTGEKWLFHMAPSAIGPKMPTFEELSAGVPAQFFAHLRSLPALQREEVMGQLRHDFCVHCGDETPAGRMCHCLNDE
jgi:hypothetical protein